MHTEIGNRLNPHRGFRGNIRNGWGGAYDYGVYPEAIVPALRRHGYTQSRAFRAGTDTLKRELAAGNPVVVWIVGNYTAERRVYLTDGAESYFVIAYEHAVTLYGYDERGVRIMDPGHGVKYHESWDHLEFGGAQLDHIALTVAKRPPACVVPVSIHANARAVRRGVRCKPTVILWRECPTT